MSKLPNNYVRVEGEIDRSKLIELEGGAYLFKGSIRVPLQYEDAVGNKRNHYTFLSIVTFGEIAYALSLIKSGSWICVEGNLEVSRYQKRCGKCNYQNTAYSTDIRVSNFVELERPSESESEYSNEDYE